MEDSPMDLYPKSMNTSGNLKNKQEDNQPNDGKLKQIVQDPDDNEPNDRKLKQKVQEFDDNQANDGKQKVQDPDDNEPNDQKLKQKDQDLDDDNQPNDRKLKEKVEIEMEKSPKLANNVDGRERIDGEEKGSIVVESSDPSWEAIKLIEEIVKTYVKHVDHVVLEAEYGIKQKHYWYCDITDVGETFAQKVRRLGCELDRMKYDKKLYKDYILIESRVTHIMRAMLMFHKLYDPDSKSREVYKLDEYRKEINKMTERVEQLKTLNIHRKEMAERRQKFLKAKNRFPNW